MDPKATYKMTIAYDGTAYGGWQVQPNAVTIQEVLQDVMSTYFRCPMFTTGSGRTDAGVHALGQSAHFHASPGTDLRRLFRSLNGMLPHDIRILSIEPVAADFHARYSATKKIYRYSLTLGPLANPFTRLYSWHIPTKFDLEALTRAAKYFVGTHNFKSFTNTGYPEDREMDTVRTIYRLECIPTPDGLALEFEGNGFLYKMVRNIVGTLVDTASGKYSPDIIDQMLAQEDRRAAGRAAPPHGLFLVKVFYD